MADESSPGRSPSARNTNAKRVRRAQSQPPANNRTVEQRAVDILALARSLVYEHDGKTRRTDVARKNNKSVNDNLSEGQPSLSYLQQQTFASSTMHELVKQQGTTKMSRVDDEPELTTPLRPKTAGSTRFVRDDIGSIDWHVARGNQSPESLPVEDLDLTTNMHKLYDARFHGLMAFGPSGMSRLEELVEAAMTASERAGAATKMLKKKGKKCAARCRPRAAALLTSGSTIHVACDVISTTDASLDVSAERAVVSHAVSDGETRFVGLVIADATTFELPVPNGATRQFLAEYGEFPVYLVNKSLQAKRLTTHELFPLRPPARSDVDDPRGRSPSKGPSLSTTLHSRGREQHPDDSSSSEEDTAADDAKPIDEWTVDEVCKWLETCLRLPQYSHIFRKAKVTGALLLRLDGNDLENMLGVKHALHRRHILGAIAAAIDQHRNAQLKDTFHEEHGVDAYIGTLDKDRIRAVARIKAAFDEYAVEVDQTKFLERGCVRDVFVRLGRDVDSPHVKDWFNAVEARRLSFLDFVDIYVDLFAAEDPDLKACDEAAKALSKRVQVLANGHVKLSESSLSSDDGAPSRLRRISLIEDDRSSSCPSSSTVDDEEKAYRRTLESKQAARAADDTFGSVRRLAELKQTFDRFAVHELITGMEAVQALTELGCTLPRCVMSSYLRERGIFGIQREMSFYEFLRAFAALELENNAQANLVRKQKRNAKLAARRKRVWSSDSSTCSSSSSYVSSDEVDRRITRMTRNPFSAANRRRKGYRRSTRESDSDNALLARRCSRKGDSDDDGYLSFPRSHRSPSPRLQRRRRLNSHDEFLVGTRVEARFRGKTRWFPAVIRRVRSNRRYDVEYEDGDRETRVDAHLIRRVAHKSPMRTNLLREGDRVEAYYRGRKKLYPGRISFDRGDGTYDIVYDDGETEMRVQEGFIHVIAKGDDDIKGRQGQASCKYAVGDKVQARFRGHSKYCSGYIARVRTDGTYDIDYDDGRKAKRVPNELIKFSGQKVSQLAREGRLKAGNRVEARYRGRSTFKPGHIARVHADGTYDIDYDDGQKEKCVDKSLVCAASDQVRDYFIQGDKVEVRYRGRDKFYPGRIIRDRRNGTYDIEYDDGEREMQVKAGYIRIIPNASKGCSKFVVGDEIDARYRGRSKYFPGHIGRVHADGTYDIEYDDGEKETRVLEQHIRSRDGHSTRGNRLRVGAKIEARYRRRAKYYPGRIARDHGDGTYDVIYDDDETESHVLEEDITLVDSDDPSPPTRRKLIEGDQVEARYRGRAKYYLGRVARDRGDGTYDIDYDDGEKELRVQEELIRLIPGGSGRSRRSRLSVGDRVEARYRGRLKVYPGRIARDRGDGTYDIHYDDGEEETRVGLDLITKLKGDHGDDKQNGKFNVGDKIEAKYRGRSTFLSGRIARVHADCTYDIEYDDGEMETRVLEKQIKPRDGSARGTVLREGAKVSARYRGRSRYYPGRIARDHGDGTYDVEYEDGEKESRVREEHIKTVASDDRLSSARGIKLVKGDKVEARYRGRLKFYPGCIAHDHGDGTYDVEYDDGERESRVQEELIRMVAGGSGRAHFVVFREGDRVEARYGGRSKLYPGRIVRDHGDGTYDIEYDDGDKERQVRKDFITKLEDRGGLNHEDEGHLKFRVGDKIDARYRGRSTYYSGHIAKVHADGTYDIDYDDGEKELRVVEKFIKPNGSSSARKNFLRVGTKIKAQYRRGEKYYPGRIARGNGDGTYDIDYEDGEKEHGVPEHCIKLVDDHDRPRSARRERLIEGVEVEVCHSVRSRCHLGRIARDRGNGTYDIDYHDGRKETRVREDLIRVLPSHRARASRSRLRAGDRVEARYRGRSKAYPGRIMRDRGDGTYDIEYDDGENETRVREDLISRLEDCDSSDGAKRKGRFRVGDHIDAKYRGRSKYYPGEIARANADGTYDVDYDDGEKETGVLEEFIEFSGDKKTRRYTKIYAGAKIEARYRGRSKYYPGRIVCDHKDGTYDVKYDDGENESRVLEEYIKVIDDGDRPHSARRCKFMEGDKVEARYRGRSKHYPGRIARDRGDGTFDIDYDDGEKETRVQGELIRLLPRSGSASRGRLLEGDRVEARYRGRLKAYPGRIARDRGDGTYDVYYDDGEKETGVRESLITKLDDDAGCRDLAKRDGKFSPGDKIEAKYRGRSKYYPGCIARVHADGTYDVDYDDGEKETRMLEDHIKPRGDTNAHGLKFREGMKIEARYQGRSRYYPGRIALDRHDGTYDIDYDDGETESRVLEEHIKPVDNDYRPRSARTATFIEGDKIEARYRARSKYYPGRIARDRGDGTYDIEYEDGEKELRVQAELIRLLPGGSARTPRVRLREGDRVEARYGGGTRVYPGRIVRDNGNGTYDIRYDDGETEFKVNQALITKPNVRSISGDEEKRDRTFGVGDEIVARYRGRSKYYPGRIARVHADGTYDVDYDDGEKETHVRGECIKNSSDEIAPRKKLSKGTKIEARYRGRSKYYPGRIARDRCDGTYDIDYDDGETELRVLEDNIKLADDYDRPRSARGAKLIEGDRVEARYRGRSVYYTGRISRDRGDRTYDIDYDDGEQESRVPDDLIRLLPGGSARVSRGRLRVGDRVEARCRGRSEAHPARIARDCGNGTYDLDFENGERESGVNEELITKLDDRPGSSEVRKRRERFAVKDKVMVMYRGRPKRYPGRIARVHADGTYDVDYDDGESEFRVLEAYIMASGDESSRRRTFREGAKIEARYRGRLKYYPGRIAREDVDGTYDIEYDDGEKEFRVPADYIRSFDDRARSGRPEKFFEGDKVEARFRGRSQFYAGRIARDRHDGTYDIDYEDGEKESRVQEELIRPLPCSSFRSQYPSAADNEASSRETGRLSAHGVGARSPRMCELFVGDEVEARYRGNGKYYPGRISRVHGNGTFDIEYIDGDRDFEVAVDRIRRKDSDRPLAHRSNFRRGERIEARYRKRSKYISGAILSVNRNGTYDIEYDDGECERDVQAYLIRPLERNDHGYQLATLD